MALETGTYISDLVATNPTSSDLKSAGDDHLRLLKSTVKATFPNISGAVTPTHTELNFVDGVTSAIQTQIDSKAAHAGQTYTGTHDFDAATSVLVPTKSASDNSTAAASTAYVDAAGVVLSAVDALKADKAGSTYTGAHNFTGGSITVPAPTVGADAATKTYVDSTAFNAALPSQTGNAGKYVTTNGTDASWAAVPAVPAGASIYTALNFGAL